MQYKPSTKFSRNRSRTKFSRDSRTKWTRI